MDQIIMLVLTVTINALVTGIIVFNFQKRMESTIIKKNFEHQVKFSKFYNKSLEVVDTLRQKTIALGTAIAEANIELSSILFLWEERNENKWYQGWVNEERKREVYNIHLDLVKYKNENSIYISDQYANEIEALLDQVFAFFMPAFNTDISLIASDEEYLEPFQTGYLVKMMEATGTKWEDMPDLEKPQIAIKLVEIMIGKHETINKKLEEMYKKVADFSS